MIRKVFAITFLALVLLSGCRPEISPPEEETVITTWADFFTTWWSEMNRNYMFWDLDSPGNEWDIVYDETLPKMEKYGDIGSSDSSDKAAIRDFYDIVKNLHDGHFVFSISNGKGISGSFRPVYYRNMREAGMTDDEIFEAQLTASPETYSDLFAVDEFHAEKTVTIMENTFGIAGASGPSGISQAFGVAKGRVAEYFSKAGYVKTPSDMTLDDENVGNFAVFVGVTKDNILYFSFSGFSFSSFFDDVFQNGDSADEWSKKICNLITEYEKNIYDFQNGISDLSGIIIDLRGNGGGNPLDFTYIWAPLLPENLTVGRYRLKISDNRLSYSQWHDNVIKGRSSNGSDKALKLPIALLVNSHSASCSEMSTMSFMAMREKYGTDLKIIGGTTTGANGPLSTNNTLNAGTFYIGESMTRCAGMQLRYIDGTSFEGIGISPDIPVNFNYDSFVKGNDTRLRMAFEFIRNR